MENIIKQIENINLEIKDYNHIINYCNNKIIELNNNKNNKIFLKNIKNIIINNEELKAFIDYIYDSIKYEHNECYKISFEFKEYSIFLCLYINDDELNNIFLEEEMHIINKNKHSYETYYKNCEEILINILDLKSVNKSELNDFIKNLFDSIPIKTFN